MPRLVVWPSGWAFYVLDKDVSLISYDRSAYGVRVTLMGLRILNLPFWGRDG